MNYKDQVFYIPERGADEQAPMPQNFHLLTYNNNNTVYSIRTMPIYKKN